MPQLKRRTGAGDTKAEMRTFQGEVGDVLHSTVGLTDVQRVVQEATAPAPSKTYWVAAGLTLYFFFFFKYK